MNSVVVSVVNDVQKWNSFLKDNSPYEFSIRLLREGGRHVFLSISNSTLDNIPQLDHTHRLFLQKCRNKFIEQITDYASYVSPNEVEDIESSENESNEIERKRRGTKLNASKTKTHHVAGCSITLLAPSWYTIRTTNQDNKINKELSVLKRALEEKEAEFETLHLKNEQYKVANERLTLERKALIDRNESILENLNQKENDILILKAQLDKEKELVRELNETTRIQKDKVKIAEMLLTLPEKAKRCPTTLQSCKFYSMAYSIIPGASSKYMQMFILVVVCAFLCDSGLSVLFDNLAWVSDLTPSDKLLDENI